MKINNKIVMIDAIGTKAGAIIKCKINKNKNNIFRIILQIHFIIEFLLLYILPIFLKLVKKTIESNYP